MAAGGVMQDWRLKWAFPWLSRWPWPSAWQFASVLGREPAAQRRHVQYWLAEKFAGIFPNQPEQLYTHWAQMHLNMLAQEMLDAMAFHRLGVAGGPSIALTGLEHVREVQAQGRGFILVLNHFDRLLTAPVALARQGIVTNVLTMPVLENSELSPAQRIFLLRKIQGYTSVTQGIWHTTSKGMRPVVDSLRAGQGWVVLADAWRPEFGKLRHHHFLGGQLSLPTGIERLANSCGAPLLHAATYTESPTRMRVVLEPLPTNPVHAIDAVVANLERDVRERPWAWWQWGQWDQMWTPPKQEGVL